MGKTDSQKAADSMVEDAVMAVRDAYDLIPAHGNVTDYIVVIEGVSYDPDGDSDEDFVGLHFRHGEMRKSVGLGLLAMAHELLLNGGRVE